MCIMHNYCKYTQHNLDRLGRFISSVPIIDWGDSDFERRITNHICVVSQDASYHVFATASSFYVPLILTLFPYWLIYQVTRSRTHHKPGLKVLLTVSANSSLILTLRIEGGNGNMLAVSQYNCKISVVKVDNDGSPSSPQEYRFVKNYNSICQ